MSPYVQYTFLVKTSQTCVFGVGSCNLSFVKNQSFRWVSSLFTPVWRGRPRQEEISKLVKVIVMVKIWRRLLCLLQVAFSTVGVRALGVGFHTGLVNYWLYYGLGLSGWCLATLVKHLVHSFIKNGGFSICGFLYALTKPLNWTLVIKCESTAADHPSTNTFPWLS